MVLWLRAAHFLGLLLWAGGLIALTRMLQLNVKAAVAQRMYRTVVAPGLFLSLLSGIWMLHSQQALLRDPNMRAKLAVVVLLLGLDHICMRGIKRLTGDDSERRGFAIVHAVVLIFLAMIVVLITVRPFSGVG